MNSQLCLVDRDGSPHYSCLEKLRFLASLVGDEGLLKMMLSPFGPEEMETGSSGC